MTAWLRDLQIGLRMLRKNPETTLVAIIAMAVAIAATSTIFGVVDRVLIRPLPFPDSDRLATIWQIDPSSPDAWQPLPYSLAPDWLRLSTSFEAIAAARNMSMTFTASEDPETPFMRGVSHPYFDILGVRPIHGRNFLAEEDLPGKPARVVILSHQMWQRRFGGDPGVIGTKVELDKAPYEVVGILPAGFFNPAFGNSEPPLMWMPLGLPRVADPDRRGGLFVVGKLLPGVRFEQARSELRQISIELNRSAQPSAGNTPARNAEALVVPLAERLVRDARPSVLVLFGAVLLVLLVACGNVANLLLTRGLGRRREMAVRRALGAGAGDLIRQMVAEALVLMTLCAALGLLVTVWAGEVVGRLAPSGFNIPRFDFTVGSHVIFFTLAVVLGAGLVFGLLPAAQALRSGVEASLGAGASRAIGGGRSSRLRGALVLGEVALSLMLLIGAGLMLRSFQGLQQIDPGYDPEDVLVFRTSTRGPEYTEPAARVEYFRRVEEELERRPGVQSVGAVQGLPFFSGFAQLPVIIDGFPTPEPGREPRIPVYSSTAGYHNAMKIPLLRGRLLTPRDNTDAPRVALVNAKMAEDFWAGGDTRAIDAIGAQLFINGETEPRRVVGIVGDVQVEGSPPLLLPSIYLPLAQAPRPTGMTFIVRTRGGAPFELLDDAELAVRTVDPRMSVFQTDTLARLTDNQQWQPRLLTSLLGIFAALGLVLAATGIYAVLSFAVSQRTREIGIRMALGARRSSVVGLVLRQGMGLAAAGIAVGAIGAGVLSRLLESQLYGVSATDPMTYVVVSLFLAGVAVLSCWMPARRATRVDPVVALGEE